LKHRLINVCVSVLCLAAPAAAQEWQPIFTDLWSTPLSGPQTAAWREDFDIHLAASNTSGDGSSIDLYDYDLQLTYPEAISYVPGSFTKPWGWDDWDVTVTDDPVVNTLTLSTASPTVPWAHTLGDGATQHLGSFAFTADELNAKDYASGDRTPWTPQITSAAIQTSDDHSTQLNASSLPTELDVLTNGQRQVVEPVPSFGPSASRSGVSWVTSATVENMQHWDGSPQDLYTDEEEIGFQPSQAYRTTMVDTSKQFAYAWSGMSGHDNNQIFSLEVIAEIDNLVVGDNPAERFTSTGRAEISPGSRLVMIGGDDLETGDAALVTVAIGTEWTATDKLSATDPEGIVDWEITVRRDAVDGAIVAVLNPGNLDETFDIVIGDDIYYEGYLQCQAVTGEWFYDAGFALYGASGATAEAKVDLWTHVAVPEPATLGLLSIGGLAVLRRKRK
jgi:hypothetical protein